MQSAEIIHRAEKDILEKDILEKDKENQQLKFENQQKDKEIQQLKFEIEFNKGPSLNTKKEVWFRDKQKCQNCGIKFVSRESSARPWSQKVPFHFCHIIPKSNYGPHIPENMVLGCPKCNNSCGTTNWNEWKKGPEAKRISDIQKNK